MAHRIYLVFITSLVFFSCEKEPDTPVVVLPSNFTTSINIDEELLDITATADNANFYTFMFYDGNDSTLIEAVDGLANYTYTSSGNFRIRSRAHVTHADFIELNETVSITIEPVGGIPSAGYSTPLTYPGYTLVWNDEFEGSSLSSDWVYETGNGEWGWGNNELEHYLQENVAVVDGYLQITAKQQVVGSHNYTSGRIKTQGRRSFQYGRIDLRAAMPFGKGYWPALWMLGDNISTASWPGCGEIDIMELVGGGSYNDRTIYGTIHWDDNGSHASYGGNNSLSSGMYADEFHVFSIIWDENSIKFLRDDIQYQIADISPAGLSEFHQKFFFIFNVAVGGNWPGSPDGSTVFPQTMYVDYVRVFQ